VDQIERYRGCLLGLATGDAVGTTLEFQSPGMFSPLDDMVGGGPFDLSPGQWTDDTSMALCLAESLIEKQSFDAADQMERYLRWYRHGYLSSNNRCFDIGGTVSRSLQRYERTGNPFSGLTDPSTAGNGSLMRLAPVPMFYAKDPPQALYYAAQSSRTTHGAQASVDACQYFAGLLVGALNGVDKDTLLSPLYCPIPGYWDRHRLHPEIAEIASGIYQSFQPPMIRADGYVVKSLEAAMWAFYSSQSFRDGCLLVVNLGDDADTSGAIYGQLAGAFYGEADIPAEWKEKLALRTTIETYAESLYQLAFP
jgi:ADP-ribosylglycohydrolase